MSDDQMFEHFIPFTLLQKSTLNSRIINPFLLKVLGVNVDKYTNIYKFMNWFKQHVASLWVIPSRYLPSDKYPNAAHSQPQLVAKWQLYKHCIMNNKINNESIIKELSKWDDNWVENVWNKKYLNIIQEKKFESKEKKRNKRKRKSIITHDDNSNNNDQEPQRKKQKYSMDDLLSEHKQKLIKLINDNKTNYNKQNEKTIQKLKDKIIELNKKIQTQADEIEKIKMTTKQIVASRNEEIKKLKIKINELETEKNVLKQQQESFLEL